MSKDSSVFQIPFNQPAPQPVDLPASDIFEELNAISEEIERCRQKLIS
ncbi:hypothetical protein IJF86_03185 [Candidatus Saccharibacteria bacterium]|nr:hypothetical protein [Candidatus Saccharibacteria bacterium]